MINYVLWVVNRIVLYRLTLSFIHVIGTITGFSIPRRSIHDVPSDLSLPISITPATTISVPTTCHTVITSLSMAADSKRVQMGPKQLIMAMLDAPNWLMA